MSAEIDYDGRRFRPLRNDSGEVGEGTVFHYRQVGDVVWGTYTGGAIQFGLLLARMLPDGSLDMRYQHLSADGSLKTGECRSKPELLDDGRVRLHESWRWTSGADGEGRSILEEIPRQAV